MSVYFISINYVYVCEAYNFPFVHIKKEPLMLFRNGDKKVVTEYYFIMYDVLMYIISI